MFLNAISNIVANVPDQVERSVHQVRAYLADAVAFVGHAAVTHPNEFVTALSAFVTMIFTGVLAFKTAGLFKETAGLREAADKQAADFKRSIDAAEKAATAARAQVNLSERVFAKLERPYLFIFGVETIQIDNTIVGSDPFIAYSVANYGKTPAIVKHASAAIFAGNEPAIPIRLDSHHNLFVAPIFAFSERRDDLREPVPDGIQCTSVGMPNGGRSECAPTLLGQDDLFFWIIITYRGAFTDHHETSACWRYDGLMNRFVQHGGSQYNYTK